MMVKVGQRKYLKNQGYTDERLDKMSTSTARNIIAQYEKKRKLRTKDYDFDWHDVTIKMSDDGEFMVQSKGLTSISVEIVGAFENLRQMQQNERRKYFENETTNNNQQ